MLTYLGVIAAVTVFTIGLFSGSLKYWDWRESQKKRRKPSKEKLLRPPGEYLRVKIAEIEEKVSVWAAVLSAMPVVLVTGLYSPNRMNRPQSSEVVVAVLASAVIICGAIWRLIRLKQESRKLNLGFSGERAVAEELNKLMLDKYYVFHDVPFDNFNVDHVIVGPSGVYAVETKTRRKSELDNREDHKLILKEGAVQFPSGYPEVQSLEQARWNAKSLSKFLTSATGEPVDVSPILTYPGWYIKRAEKCDVTVVDTEGIRICVVRNGLPALTEQRIQQIVHQLDQKCRTVEF